MFHKLRSIYLWFLGRKPIVPFSVDSYDGFVRYLESTGKRVEQKSRITFGFDGYFSSGYFFYDNSGEIFIKHEARLLKSSWYFRGNVNESASVASISGSFRVLPVFELMINFVLAVVAFGASSLFYMPFLGRSVSLSDVAIVLIGYPLFLLTVRFMMKPIPYIGGRSIHYVNNIFEEYKNRDID